MSSFGIRPSFSHLLEMSVEEARERIVEQVQSEPGRCEVKSFPGFVCLRIPEQERHFWSPRLNLSLDATEDGKTRIQGTYGPNANMWGLFLYGFVAVGTLTMISGILGLCQWKIGHQPWGLWIFFSIAAIGVGLYLLAQFGQKLGAQQTFRLHQIFEAAIGTMVEIR